MNYCTKLSEVLDHGLQTLPPLLRLHATGVHRLCLRTRNALEVRRHSGHRQRFCFKLLDQAVHLSPHDLQLAAHQLPQLCALLRVGEHALVLLAKLPDVPIQDLLADSPRHLRVRGSGQLLRGISKAAEDIQISRLEPHLQLLHFATQKLGQFCLQISPCPLRVVHFVGVNGGRQERMCSADRKHAFILSSTDDCELSGICRR
mmetsp:Transcript_126761/g.219720  ORF Transcript_126761/g.219720 Transcript_126761/m.219720 type:complete len:203 (-) Transcript_126761:161-769(-)